MRLDANAPWADRSTPLTSMERLAQAVLLSAVADFTAPLKATDWESLAITVRAGRFLLDPNDEAGGWWRAVLKEPPATYWPWVERLKMATAMLRACPKPIKRAKKRRKLTPPTPLC